MRSSPLRATRWLRRLPLLAAALSVGCGSNDAAPADGEDAAADSGIVADSTTPGDTRAADSRGSDTREGDSAPPGDSGGIADSRTTPDTGVSADSTRDSADSATSSDTASDATDASCPAPPAALPSGALTRNPTNPLLRNGPETYDDLKTGPRVVLKLGGSDYRIWYEAVSSSGITSVAYATSGDGLSWTKRGVVMAPTLGWEKSEVSPNSILIEGGVYKLWYHAGGYPASSGARLGKAAVGYATSLDGLTWTKHGPEVLDLGPTGAFDDSQVAEPRVFALGGGYRMYYTGRNAATNDNALGMATSADGIAWTKSAANPILDVGRWGHFWGGAFFVDARGVWNLWHGVQSGSSSWLEFMWSADGVAWTDGPSGPVLSQSTDSTQPDYGLVGDSVSGYLDGTAYRIMYTGFNSSLDAAGRFEGICMASVTATCP